MGRPKGSGPTAGSWKKGQVTNPKGRPPETKALRILARQYTEVALMTLVAALEDPKGNVRVMAANSILDRGYGKPEQAITGEDGKPIRMGVIFLPELGDASGD